jgi:hypothetical protein
VTAAGSRCDRCWRTLVSHAGEADRADAARREDLPAWARATLALDRSPLVRAEIAGRADLPDRLIATLADPAIEPDRAVLRRIARHPRLGRHARTLAGAGDLYTLRHLVQNPSCPAEALDVLAAHPDPTVHGRARARLVGASLDDAQRLRLPLGLRHLLT